MKRRHSRLTTIATVTVLVLTGLGVMFYPKLTDVRYAYEQWRFEATADAAEPAVETGVALPEGAVARIEIPAIGVDAYVVEGTDSAALNQGPGHYPGTPLPGDDGNSAIAGHRTMYGHVFHDLHLLHPGDEIRTGTASRTAVYRVLEIRVVDDSDTSVVQPTDDSRLTLTTCHPIGSARQRLVVVAERED